ncbi:MAG: gamma-glutamylcyclotransferase family protein [Hyphomicrobiaceae bacterium]|nr:gamma-glutamylcyclotransferase family protein [Hyphomicrobiaceae bacterium]
MNPHLFVYGTLMSHTHTDKARQLAAEADSLGAATMAGTLYRISWYPGLVEGAGLVHGEVFRLRDPAASLVWLDAYEGIVPGDGQANRNEYERLERSVRLASGRELLSWVYLYRAGVAGCVPVAGGRWMT